MIKYKRTTDGVFEVIDIYPEGTKRSDIPLLLCRNDVNNNTFEVHVNGTFEYQMKYLSIEINILDVNYSLPLVKGLGWIKFRFM